MSISIACLGLSAFIYSSLAPLSLMPGIDATSSFMLLLAVGCGSSVLLSAVLMNPPAIEQSKSVYTPRPDAGRKHDDAAPSTPASRSQSITISPEDSATVVAMEKSRSRQSIYDLPVDVPKDVRGWELVSNGDFGLLYLFLGLLTGCGLMCESAF